MKQLPKILILFIGLFLIKGNSFCQETDLSKKYKLSDFIQVYQITGIEIYNTWTGKRWTISNKNLNIVKSILNQSSVHKYVPLKPGHLYIKFLGLDFKNYYTYMYNETICFDPYYDKNTLKPFKNTTPFSIELRTKINWAKLK